MAAVFNADIADLQWIVDAYAVTFAGLLLAGGALGDRIGRQRALTIGFAIVATSNVLAALSSSIAAIITMRSIGGLGAAIMMPAALAAVSEVFSNDERARAIAVWASIAAAGGAFGPLLGGAMLALAGWEAVFVLKGALGVAGVLGTRIWVPELPGQRTGPFDGVGAALSVIAVGSLVFLVIEGPLHPTGPLTILSAVTALGSIYGFFWRQAHTENPILPLELFADRNRVLGAGTLALAAIGFNGVFFVGALLIQIGWGESGLVAGLLLVPIGVTELIVANTTVQLAKRFGTTRLITWGLAALAVGYIAMGLTPAGNRWWFVIAGIIAGTGNGLAIPLSIDRIVGSVEPAFAGVASSVNDMAIELGASLGIGLLGTIQRLWFEAGLPDTSAATLSDVSTDAERMAFRSGSTAAFMLAAVVALLAIPVARAKVPPPSNVPT